MIIGPTKIKMLRAASVNVYMGRDIAATELSLLFEVLADVAQSLDDANPIVRETDSLPAMLRRQPANTFDGLYAAVGDYRVEPGDHPSKFTLYVDADQVGFARSWVHDNVAAVYDVTVLSKK